jgi:hypothetical protein
MGGQGRQDRKSSTHELRCQQPQGEGIITDLRRRQELKNIKNTGKRQRFIHSLQRVSDVYENQTGVRLYNLNLFLRRLRKGRYWYEEDIPEDAAVMLKGYFLWDHHIVQPMWEEVRMLTGYAAAKSEQEDYWTPRLCIDGTAAWQEPCLVRFGRERYVITYKSHCVYPQRLKCIPPNS